MLQKRDATAAALGDPRAASEISLLQPEVERHRCKRLWPDWRSSLKPLQRQAPSAHADAADSWPGSDQAADPAAGSTASSSSDGSPVAERERPRPASGMTAAQRAEAVAVLQARLARAQARKQQQLSRQPEGQEELQQREQQLSRQQQGQEELPMLQRRQQKQHQKLHGGSQAGSSSSSRAGLAPELMTTAAAGAARQLLVTPSCAVRLRSAIRQRPARPAPPPPATALAQRRPQQAAGRPAYHCVRPELTATVGNSSSISIGAADQLRHQQSRGAQQQQRQQQHHQHRYMAFPGTAVPQPRRQDTSRLSQPGVLSSHAESGTSTWIQSGSMWPAADWQASSTGDVTAGGTPSRQGRRESAFARGWEHVEDGQLLPPPPPQQISASKRSLWKRFKDLLEGVSRSWQECQPRSG